MRVKGPKNNKFIAAKFNGKTKSLFKNSLQETTSLVLLSIKGNEFCQNKYLEAIINQALQSPHKLVTFLIADEIHWHNLKDEKDPTVEKELKQQANDLGSNYFEDHLQYFLKPLGLSVTKFNTLYGDLSTSEKIKVINEMAQTNDLGFQIIRWQDWLKHSIYEKKQLALEKLCQLDSELQSSINLSANEFAKRHEDEADYDLWLTRSKDYLIEETAAVIWLAIALDYNFIIYPGKMPKPFEAMKNYLSHQKNHAIYGFPEDDINVELTANWLEVFFQRVASPIADNQNVINNSLNLSDNGTPLIIPSINNLSSPGLQKEKELGLAGLNPHRFFNLDALSKVLSHTKSELKNTPIKQLAYEVTQAIVAKGDSPEKQSELFTEFLNGVTTAIIENDGSLDVKTELIEHLFEKALVLLNEYKLKQKLESKEEEDKLCSPALA
ncbi:hypothetical protein ACNVED_00265 [Legionella sp. D16C41]|uniref:hypothetical protein n=1 Tax=Legionella sp. D16C41 TaxID=3402688 RepID=UPI003AF600DA